MSQRLDRIERGRLTSRIKTKTDSNRRANYKSYYYPVERENDRNLQPSRYAISDQYTKEGTDCCSD